MPDFTGRFPFVVSLLIAILAASGIAQQRWYVDADATGADTGQSWTHAFNDLQDALDAATHGDSIWVAAGTYRPGQGSTDRESTFNLVNGVSLFGGFNGTEQQREQRDWFTYPTTLSGDLNGDDAVFINNTENVYNVVRADNVGTGTVLDGFVVTGGNANGPSHQLHKDNGGGLHIYQSDLVIANCLFVRNSARLKGGGISCTFSSGPRVDTCIFQNNRVTGGYTSDGGGGMFVYSFSTPHIVDCRFEFNHAGGSGGALKGYWQNDSLVERCIFERNDAWYGGAIQEIESALTVRDCVVRNNDAIASGGGILVDYDSIVAIEDCLIEGNIADDAGGILAGSSMTLRATTIRGNMAARYGGGIFFATYLYGVPTVQGCEISGNAAGWGAGTYHRYYSEVVIADTLIANNVADSIGGGLAAFDNAELTLQNLTVVDNSAPVGAGLAFDAQGTTWSGIASIVNSIFWNDGDEIHNDNLSVIDVTYSNVRGGHVGDGNFDTEPGFIDAGVGDYHLALDSPCRDAGDPSANLNPTDFEGDPRVADQRIDVGADEFFPHLYFRGTLASAQTLDACIIGQPGDAVTLALSGGILDEPLSTPYGWWHLRLPLNRRIELGVVGPRGSLIHRETLPTIPPDVTFPFQALIGQTLSNLEVVVSAHPER